MDRTRQSGEASLERAAAGEEGDDEIERPDSTLLDEDIGWQLAQGSGKFARSGGKGDGGTALDPELLRQWRGRVAGDFSTLCLGA